MIAKKEKAKKIDATKATEPQKMEEEPIKEFDETEYRETVKLNELMADLKLEEENEEDELRNFDAVVNDFNKIELTKK